MFSKMKSGATESFLPCLAMFVSTALLVNVFSMFRALNETVFEPIVNNAGEETNATYGRLLYTMLAFILCIVVTLLADKILKTRGEEKLMLPWLLASCAGLFLWQSIGESSWHFGMNVFDDEGMFEYVTFTRIEGIQGLPFLIIIGILYIAMDGKVSFAVQSCLAAFLANWYGHICLIGTFPIAKMLGYSGDMVSWYRISGLVNGVIFLVVGLYFTFFNQSKKKRYLAANHIYIAVGVFLCGTIMGMT